MKNIIDLKTATEEQLREFKTPTPQTLNELNDIISQLESRSHTYGTCVYAMSISAEATFNYIASKLGVTGFQASCADLDFLGRTRNMKKGFAILNYENLLYPQYCDDEHFPTYKILIQKNAKFLKDESQKLLAGKNMNSVHIDVIAHWKYLSELEIPEELNNELSEKGEK